MLKIIDYVLPLDSKRRKYLRERYHKTLSYFRKPKVSYKKWISVYEPNGISANLKHKYKPLISIVVPLYNTPDSYLIPMIESVINQTYTNWELCLVQGGSTRPARVRAILRCSDLDDRIHIINSRKNLGISGNTNLGLKTARGEFIAFLDHDDTLAPFALNEVVEALNKHKADLIYSDEDKLSEDGTERSDPFFKPDWSPDLLLAINYMAHFIVVRRSLVEKVGGLRKEYDGAQDYDFLLRVIEHNPKIHHIPHVLYHWRLAEGSTAAGIEKKAYAIDAGRHAIEDYLRRNKVVADVEFNLKRPTNYHIRYSTEKNPLVTIIIPFKDKARMTKACVNSILKNTGYRNFEILLISNQSTESTTKSFIKNITKNKKVRCVIYDKPFNYSAINNFGREHSTGEVLLFMNNDTKVIDKEWLGEMLGVAIQPSTGVVGAWLHYQDKSTQHAGVIIGMVGLAGHVFRNINDRSRSPYGLINWPRNYLAVTGACLMVRAKIFDSIGGFDENFIVCGSDVALGLDIHKAGYRNVFWPYARLLHYESKSVGSYKNAPKGDYDLSLRRYEPYLSNGDPYFNSNLSLESEQVVIKGEP